MRFSGLRASSQGKLAGARRLPKVLTSDNHGERLLHPRPRQSRSRHLRARERLRPGVGAPGGADHGPDAVPGDAPVRAAGAGGGVARETLLGEVHAVRRDLPPVADDRGRAGKGVRWLFREIYNETEYARRKRRYMEIVKELI